jgi:ubiquinone/menaquinone biosynthesis C-methylase UbiE
MLRAADPLAGVHYVQATAVRLPLAAESADVVVVAASFRR